MIIHSLRKFGVLALVNDVVGYLSHQSSLVGLISHQDLVLRLPQSIVELSCGPGGLILGTKEHAVNDGLRDINQYTPILMCSN